MLGRYVTNIMVVKDVDTIEPVYASLELRY